MAQRPRVFNSKNCFEILVPDGLRLATDVRQQYWRQYCCIPICSISASAVSIDTVYSISSHYEVCFPKAVLKAEFSLFISSSGSLLNFHLFSILFQTQ